MSVWITEFSKKVVVMCAILHAAVFTYAALLMWHFADASALQMLIEESSDIMKTCVFGYMVKSGVENWQKIKKSPSASADEDEETTE